MHRFFIPPDWLHGSSVILWDPVTHQIRSVLRMRPGARIVVLDNQGWEYEVELVEVRTEHSKGEVKEKRPATGEPEARITLYQCLLKKDNFEWVLQKGTEIGVTRFVPVISQRAVIPDLDSVRSHKLSRWERIITEAAEQSRRGLLPALDEPRTFAEAVSESESYHLALIPWERETTRHIRAALEDFRASDRASAEPDIALFIGPEGGFADEEVSQAQRAGAVPVTLGPRILRAETAAVTAALLTLYELGE
jgi:16S rRNA (uracil1498-N3)-methyltransferase